MIRRRDQHQAIGIAGACKNNAAIKTAGAVSRGSGSIKIASGKNASPAHLLGHDESGSPPT